MLSVYYSMTSAYALLFITRDMPLLTWRRDDELAERGDGDSAEACHADDVTLFDA